MFMTSEQDAFQACKQLRDERVFIIFSFLVLLSMVLFFNKSLGLSEREAGVLGILFVIAFAIVFRFYKVTFYDEFSVEPVNHDNKDYVCFSISIISNGSPLKKKLGFIIPREKVSNISHDTDTIKAYAEFDFFGRMRPVIR